MRRFVLKLCTLALLMAVPVAYGDDGARLLSVDHYIRAPLKIA